MTFSASAGVADIMTLHVMWSNEIGECQQNMRCCISYLPWPLLDCADGRSARATALSTVPVRPEMRQLMSGESWAEPQLPAAACRSPCLPDSSWVHSRCRRRRLSMAGESSRCSVSILIGWYTIHKAIELRAVDLTEECWCRVGQGPLRFCCAAMSLLALM